MLIPAGFAPTVIGLDDYIRRTTSCPLCVSLLQKRAAEKAGKMPFGQNRHFATFWCKQSAFEGHFRVIFPFPKRQVAESHSSKPVFSYCLHCTMHVFNSQEYLQLSWRSKGATTKFLNLRLHLEKGQRRVELLLDLLGWIHSDF